MEISKLFSLEAAPSPIHTREQALAEEIFLHFNKQIGFSRIMKMIKTRGESFVYNAFNEIKSGDKIKNPVALFIWKCK